MGTLWISPMNPIRIRILSWRTQLSHRLRNIIEIALSRLLQIILHLPCQSSLLLMNCCRILTISSGFWSYPSCGRRQQSSRKHSCCVIWSILIICRRWDRKMRSKGLLFSMKKIKQKILHWCFVNDLEMEYEMKQKISICIPTYNRDGRLDTSLNMTSKAIKRRDDIDIYISDNASTDSTSDIVCKYQRMGVPIHYSRNEKNLGGELSS